jgi:hypothetical protein
MLLRSESGAGVKILPELYRENPRAAEGSRTRSAAAPAGEGKRVEGRRPVVEMNGSKLKFTFSINHRQMTKRQQDKAQADIIRKERAERRRKRRKRKRALIAEARQFIGQGVGQGQGEIVNRRAIVEENVSAIQASNHHREEN